MYSLTRTTLFIQRIQDANTTDTTDVFFISTICKVVLRIQDYYMIKNTSLTNSFWHLRSFARALVLNEVFVMMYFTKI